MIEKYQNIEHTKWRNYQNIYVNQKNVFFTNQRLQRSFFLKNASKDNILMYNIIIQPEKIPSVETSQERI